MFCIIITCIIIVLIVVVVVGIIIFIFFNFVAVVWHTFKYSLKVE